MRKSILGTVVCLGSLVGLGSKPAAAQMVETLKVTLPCAATVGGVTLPAGAYTIRDMHDDGNSSVLQITGQNGRSVDVMAMQVEGAKRSNETKVILKQSGESFKIQSLWFEGLENGYELLSAQ